MVYDIHVRIRDLPRVPHVPLLKQTAPHNNINTFYTSQVHAPRVTFLYITKALQQAFAPTTHLCIYITFIKLLPRFYTARYNFYKVNDKELSIINRSSYVYIYLLYTIK